MGKARKANDDGRRFFSFAWGGSEPEGTVELRHIADGKVKSYTVSTRDAYQDAIAKLSDGEKPGALYHGVALRRDNGRKKEHIAGTYLLWAEIDTEKMGWDTAKCLRALHSLPYELQPSCVVHSGYGIHCYWKLTEPLQDIEKIEQANKVLQSLVSGDHVWNADRILRCPSSWNMKYGDRKQARIVWLYDWHRHDIYDLIDAELSFGRVLYDGEFITHEEAEAKLDAQHEQYSEDAAWQSAKEDRRRTKNAKGERIWDKCRYGGGLGYVGIHEAALMYTAYRYCILKEPTEEKIEAIVRDTLEHIERVWKRDAGNEEWNWQAEERSIRKMIASWAPKWAGIKARNNGNKARKAQHVRNTRHPVS